MPPTNCVHCGISTPRSYRTVKINSKHVFYTHALWDMLHVAKLTHLGIDYGLLWRKKGLCFKIASPEKVHRGVTKTPMPNRIFCFIMHINQIKREPLDNRLQSMLETDDGRYPAGDRNQ
eukprot:38739_1